MTRPKIPDMAGSDIPDTAGRIKNWFENKEIENKEPRIKKLLLLTG